jgi:hypothetical protein
MSKSKRECRRQFEREHYLFHVAFEWLDDVVLAILTEHDPVGIAACSPTEYDTEVHIILPRVGEVATVEDLTAILHEESVRIFIPRMAGSLKWYQPIAEQIWNAYLWWSGG